MPRLGKLVSAGVVSLSLITSSTAALASAPSPAPAANGWLTLSMLTPSGAAVLGSTAIAAAQPETPPPPPPPAEYAGPSTPPIPVLIVWLGVLAVDIYLLTRHHHHHANSPF
jgi:hypothetical protein